MTTHQGGSRVVASWIFKKNRGQWKLYCAGYPVSVDWMLTVSQWFHATWVLTTLRDILHVSPGVNPLEFTSKVRPCRFAQTANGSIISIRQNQLARGSRSTSREPGSRVGGGEEVSGSRDSRSAMLRSRAKSNTSSMVSTNRIVISC